MEAWRECSCRLGEDISEDCSPVAEKQWSLFCANVLLAVVVSITNFAIRTLQTWSIKREKYCSRSQEAKGIFVRNFLLYFANTLLVVFLCGGRVGGLTLSMLVYGLTPDLDSYLTSTWKQMPRNFERHWYTTVGMKLALIAAANIFVPILLLLLAELLSYLVRFRPSTQISIQVTKGPSQGQPIQIRNEVTQQGALPGQI